MTLSIKQDKVESIIDHFYRLCFISSIWEKENPKKSHLHGTDLFIINTVMINLNIGGIITNKIQFKVMIWIQKLKMLMNKKCLHLLK